MSDTPQVDLPDGYRLVCHDALTSTNDEARRLADTGAEAGTIVWARRQTAGRGRRGRTWDSQGGNLFASIIVRPTCSVEQAMQVVFVAANAVYAAVAASLPEGPEVRCKWPNDILIDGKKVCGMLLETGGITGTVVDWLVAGIGINVAHYPKDGLYPATSLAEHGATPNIEKVLSRLAFAFNEEQTRWETDGFGAVRQRWLSQCTGLGGPIRVVTEQKTRNGVFETLDEHGALVLRTEDGLERITAGDVFLPVGRT